MSRRLKTAAAALVVTGGLAGAAIASAATSTTPTTPTTPTEPPPAQSAMPPRGDHDHGGPGHCPHMDGGSSSSAPSDAPSGYGAV